MKSANGVMSIGAFLIKENKMIKFFKTLKEAIRRELFGNKWSESFLWCPSQLERDYTYNGEIYTLYLRWRWNDPWTFCIVTKDFKRWSEDLFEKNNLFFIDDDFILAELEAEKIWNNLDKAKLKGMLK